MTSNLLSQNCPVYILGKIYKERQYFSEQVTHVEKAGYIRAANSLSGPEKGRNCLHPLVAFTPK